MTEPTTEAGRALATEIRYDLMEQAPLPIESAYQHNEAVQAADRFDVRILAIEAEAIAQERERLRVAEVERVEMLRRLLERARLVSQWHDSIGSGPIEELNAELGELGDLCRWYAALIQDGSPATEDRA